FVAHTPATFALEAYGARPDMIPPVVPTFSTQGRVKKDVADLLGLPSGIPVAYRAGDQPNNAMSLGVLHPGQVAATGGTSGVVYGVMDEPVYDRLSRVNSFAHVNYLPDDPRTGVLLCINGAGIQYRWMRQMTGSDIPYHEMEKLAAGVPVNSDGLRILPFGNGAERMLQNRDMGSHLLHLQLNRHGKAHLYRAALEGVAYAFCYGMEILREMGIRVQALKAGNDNLFQSSVFATTITSVLDCTIDLVETTGAVGAARAVGYALGHYPTLDEAMSGDKIVRNYGPAQDRAPFHEGYALWKQDLERMINK
ncbi:MAG: FGGY-family carbohydrate kinase, partial [Cyclobacteriaceae bacterium]|nr:FGGY-family carbohydrate kinase [Cyclobacteriaceae bacterium]